MAPFGPAPEMVSKLISFSACVSLRMRLELARGGDLVEPALRRLAVEPGEEARHGRPVALVGGARALDLGRVLARLGQQARDRARARCVPCRP